jgi:arginyl-tRNA synthetase
MYELMCFVGSNRDSFRIQYFIKIKNRKIAMLIKMVDARHKLAVEYLRFFLQHILYLRVTRELSIISIPMLAGGTITKRKRRLI